ncbi:SDR family NAD(P)-dependent oxidoreductase [Amycolatopsis pigmentata]|uniref:SDR family NAD(P)-dependent oxidoreductase n=1 Tax=Amycolatopsis pigmentata TaxID=450801 RepID=A0ABW5FMR3_9PSEU
MFDESGDTRKPGNSTKRGLSLRDIAGAVGIVTGASRGIGPVIAAHLADLGVRLALVARSRAGLEKTAQTIARPGREPLIITADLTEIPGQQRVIDTVCQELGPPELLICNAGIEYLTLFHEAPVEAIREVILTNLFGTEALVRVALPHMLRRRRGHIVVIGSVGGRTAYPYATVNCSAKHGLVGFTWSLREELRGSGVGVSAVYPTMVSRVGIAARWNAGGRPALLRTVPPEAVAAAVLRCIRRDRVEITVAPPLERVADVCSAVSPRLTAWMARTAGVYRFLRAAAARTAAEREFPKDTK